MFFIFFIVTTVFSQQYLGKKYPSYGGGIAFGYSYYFPKDLNDYIDVSGYASDITKEHIHSGIDVGLFLTFALNKYFEIDPEFSYLYSRHSFGNADIDLIVSYLQFGGTIYYIKMIQQGINLRLGGGISNHRGNVSWESGYSVPQTWEGSSIGLHAAAGSELVLSSNMSVSLLIIGRFANIEQLKHKDGYIIKKRDGSNKNLHLNFSGIEVKALISYYF